MYWPFRDWIAPDNLLSLVRNTAPYLFATAPPGVPPEHPRGFLTILSNAEAMFNDEAPDEQVAENYFALCLAAHHATVATFVPTDVDSKIRGVIWNRVRSTPALERMFTLALHAMHWDLDGISKRSTALSGVGPVSGHNGEQLSVLTGALCSFLRAGEETLAEAAQQAIHQELEREATEFRYAMKQKGAEIETLRLSTSLTHNVGDLDQGISYWPKSEPYRSVKARFARLAHENKTPYGGVYQIAARVYKNVMSAEGHRNYPLRGIKALRQSPQLLLPLGPFLDEWGTLIAKHPLLNDQDRADVLAALLEGCRKIAGQRGYFRAIAGMAESLNIEAIVRLMPTTARATWKDGQVRKEISVPRASFESRMKKLLQESLSKSS